MGKEKSVVEEALLQMKRIEEAISENAKGILASTMKEEISQLVKESLRGDRRLHEQDIEEPPVEDEFDVEDEEEEVVEPAYDEEGVEEPEITEPEEDGDEFEGDNQEMPPLDMTQASTDELLRVFKAMGDEDGIIVKKQDDGDIHLVDNNNNTEYLISFGGEEEEEEEEEPMGMMENYMEDMEDMEDMEKPRMSRMSRKNMEDMEKPRMSRMSRKNMEDMEDMEEMYDFKEEDDHIEEEDENVYEIDQDTLESVIESFKYSKTPNMDKVSHRKKEGDKRYGKSGNAKIAAKYPKGELKHGVTEVEKYSEMEEEWTEEVEEELVNPEADSAEHTEAARTMTYRRRAERGRVAAPRAVKESKNTELRLLEEKNEEYKKALDFFRKKLDEVAVFNSNLAYSTRLFTEHSTTKQEKINILRRFDNVETIKESKNLYKTIKEELNGDVTSNTITESVQNKVVRTPKNGSSSNLIESKTYENPQFLRMKDLMTKIK